MMTTLEKRTGIRPEKGWFGAFTRREAPGAIGNGSRVVKVATEPGDAHPTGANGTVLGSYFNPYLTYPHNQQIMYFIEWDDEPRTAVACVGSKLARSM